MISNLIEADQSLDAADWPARKLDLDDLIQGRIERATDLASQKGAGREAVDKLLCGLSVLPPLVPLEDLAVAFGISIDEAKRFICDLSPLVFAR